MQHTNGFDAEVKVVRREGHGKVRNIKRRTRRTRRGGGGGEGKGEKEKEKEEVREKGK